MTCPNSPHAFDGYYILDEDGEPIEVDLATWSAWFEQNRANRHLARTEIGNAVVSTVFLGIDHAYGGGEPVLWETMIFDVGSSPSGEIQTFRDYQDRYTSREDALAGHERACDLVHGEAVS